MVDENPLESKLRADCKKKIDTTMIGALSAIEELFGELWNHKSNDKTDEQFEWYHTYEKLRSRILDNGNNQKRKLEEELDGYDVKAKRYHYNLSVKSR